MSSSWRQGACLTLLLVCNTLTLQAQSSEAEVMLTEESVSAAVFEVLHAALSREGIGLRRAAAAAACSGTLGADARVRARVSLQWRKHLVTLCFQDACGSTERVLGPFAELDARAREEIITVIESGLAALPLHCQSGAPAQDVAEPALRSAASVPAATATAAAPERSRSAQELSTQASAVAPADTALVGAAASERGEPSTLSQLPEFVHAQPAADSRGEKDAVSRSEHTLLLAARYGITRWSSRVVGQYLGGAMAYAVHSHPLFIAIEVDYAPPFRATQDALSITGSSLRFAVQLWARWPLAQRAVLDVQLGPAIDWLSLTPGSTGDQMLQERRAVGHLDPSLFARAGPSVRVYKDFFVGIELQLDTSFLARSYGFFVGEAQREVFAPDRVRMSVALHARAEL